MNRARSAELLRRIGELCGELATELEAEETKRERRRRVIALVPPRIDEVAAKKADRILEEKGLKR